MIRSMIGAERGGLNLHVSQRRSEVPSRQWASFDGASYVLRKVNRFPLVRSSNQSKKQYKGDMGTIWVLLIVPMGIANFNRETITSAN